MDFGAALMGFLIAGVVKVAVMVLGARLVVKLYRATYPEHPSRLWLYLPKDSLPEVRLMWWSLVLFFVSEFTCGIEIYIITQAHPILTTAHGIASSVGMGLFALGMYLYVDRHLLRYAQAGCLLNRVCPSCPVRDGRDCRFLQVLLFGGTLVALAALPPWFASLDPMPVDPRKFVLPFESWNAWYDRAAVPWMQTNLPGFEKSGVAFVLPSFMMVLEFRILPAAALVVALAGIVCLLRRREHLGVRVLVFAAGVLAYTYFEIVLYRGTGDALIGSLGHELGELWFVLATAEFLQRAFDPSRTPQRQAVAAT